MKIVTPVHFLILSATAVLIGCHVQPPEGNVIQPRVLGSVVDQVYQQQEENAEYAKFIVYQHEFEMNLQDSLRASSDKRDESAFTFKPETRIRGYRLTPDGESHVGQIANVIKNHTAGFMPFVVVEQSNTSKRWGTKHRYPVHGNDELDAFRRQIVVNVLQALGVENADQLVIVAPAFPTPLSAREAAVSFERAISNGGAGN